MNQNVISPMSIDNENGSNGLKEKNKNPRQEDNEDGQGNNKGTREETKKSKVDSSHLGTPFKCCGKASIWLNRIRELHGHAVKFKKNILEAKPFTPEDLFQDSPESLHNLGNKFINGF